MQPQEAIFITWNGPTRSKEFLQPSPLGTVGIIAPWNFPVGLIFILLHQFSLQVIALW